MNHISDAASSVANFISTNFNAGVEYFQSLSTVGQLAMGVTVVALAALALYALYQGVTKVFTATPQPTTDVPTLAETARVDIEAKIAKAKGLLAADDENYKKALSTQSALVTAQAEFKDAQDKQKALPEDATAEVKAAADEVVTKAKEKLSEATVAAKALFTDLDAAIAKAEQEANDNVQTAADILVKLEERKEPFSKLVKFINDKNKEFYATLESASLNEGEKAAQARSLLHTMNVQKDNLHNALEQAGKHADKVVGHKDSEEKAKVLIVWMRDKNIEVKQMVKDAQNELNAFERRFDLSKPEIKSKANNTLAGVAAAASFGLSYFSELAIPLFYSYSIPPMIWIPVVSGLGVLGATKAQDRLSEFYTPKASA